MEALSWSTVFCTLRRWLSFNDLLRSVAPLGAKGGRGGAFMVQPPPIEAGCGPPP